MPLLHQQFDIESIKGTHERAFVELALHLLAEFEKGSATYISEVQLDRLRAETKKISTDPLLRDQMEEFVRLVGEYPGSDEIPSPVNMYDLFNSLNEIVFTLTHPSQRS